MAGCGPPPSNPNRLAGHGAAKARASGMRVITAEPTKQPPLPSFTISYLDANDRLRTKKFTWPAQTRQWWKMWDDSPLSAEFTSTDWSELLDTALLHAKFWTGDHKVANELRLRVANFGATPADRARLRIQFATANELEKKSEAPARKPARARRGALKAV